MSTSKKIASVALTITTGVWMSGALFLVPVAQAQTDIQNQIDALMAQIQQLQTKLQPQGTGAAMSSNSFTRNLTVGSKGDDVKALQQFLNSHGAQVAASGAGSPGNETTYFGPATKRAVAKWQASSSISPASGYFGPKTRGSVSAMMASTGGTTTGGTTTGGTTTGGTTTGGTTTGGTTTGGTTTGPVIPAPASGLQVALAPENPAPGSLIAGSARGSVFAVTLTAGTASGITLADLKFHKTGVVSDSSISGAYLVENGKVLYQYQSIASGVIDFGGLSLNIAAGQTRKLWLQVDTATGVNAGNTLSFSMVAATDITASDATGASVTAAGTFPLNGNTFTVTTVTSPSIASLTIASSSIGTQITAGTQNNIVGAWQFTVANSAVKLGNINFRVIGSATKSDIKNVKLYVNSSQVGTTLASVASDGTAYFDLSSTLPRLNTGTNNVQVYADVMGSASYSFQFEILNSYDVYAVDSQYNVPVTAQSNVGTSVTIKAGTITVTQDTATPTGNIAKGQNAITLAKFDVFAAGETVRMKWLEFKLTFTGTTATLPNMVKNISLVDDAGGQVGTTVNTPPSSNTCTDSTVAAGYNVSGTVYTDCFGTSASPINYIVPANTTRVLSLKADIQSTAGFSTVTAALNASTNNNLQGLSSSQNANSGSVAGSALSLASTALTSAQSTAVGTQNYSSNSRNVKVGSYALTASSAEGVTISNLTVKTGAYGDETQNLVVKVGTAQFGSTQATLSLNTSYSFSGTAFTVPAGQTTYVDVYADLLSNASGTLTTATTLASCTGSGLLSFSAVSCSPTNTAGQSVSVGAQPALRIALDSGTAPAGQIVMGATGAPLATFLFTETTNVESIKITDMNVLDVVAATSGASAVKAAFSNLHLFQGSTDLGSAGTAQAVASTTAGYFYSFHFSNPVTVPQASTVSIILKGDAASYPSSGATDNTTHVFRIEATNDTANKSTNFVVALGLSSNASATVTTSTAVGNAQTVLRTLVNVSSALLGSAVSRVKATADDLGTITFAANSAGSAVINTVTLTFSGSLGSSTSQVFIGGANLYDSSNGTNATVVATSGTCLAGNTTCSVTFAPAYTLGPGASKTFNVRVNSFQGLTAPANTAATVAVTVANLNDMMYTDGLDSVANGTITLPRSSIPVNVMSASYASGT